MRISVMKMLPWLQVNELSKQQEEKGEEVEGLRATSPEVIYAEDLETFLLALTAVEEDQQKNIANLVAQQQQALNGRKKPVKVGAQMTMCSIICMQVSLNPSPLLGRHSHVIERMMVKIKGQYKCHPPPPPPPPRAPHPQICL